MIKKTISVICVLVMLLVVTALPASADVTIIQTKGNTVTADYSDSISISVEDDIFFDEHLMAPGDVYHSLIKIKNASEKDLQVSLIEVKNKNIDPALFEALDLRIDYNSDVVYEGKYKTIDSPVFGWITIPAHGERDMNITTIFPAECANEYQKTKLLADWVFETRISELDADDDSSNRDRQTPDETEKTQTGDERNYYYGFFFLGAATVLALFIVILGIKKKQKKN